MIMNAIYGYLIFSLCCGGVLILMLWLDNRQEALVARKKADADGSSQALSSSEQTAEQIEPADAGMNSEAA